MWGKLTERNDRTRTKVISKPKELYRILATPGSEVSNFVFANDDVVWVSWKYAAEEHVYRYIDRMQENEIYCDKNSVIYIQLWDEPKLIETGDKLEDMTSELRPSESIVEFVSGGQTIMLTGCSILRPDNRKPSVNFGA